MSGSASLPEPSERFAAVSAIALAAILFGAILTIWVTGRWSVNLFEAGVLALAAVWCVRLIFRPYRVHGSFGLIPLAGAPLIGLLQLAGGHTVNRWATWTAVLNWTAYLAAFSVALQICSAERILANFRRALLYFVFALSVVSVLQYFTSPGKIFWLFQAESDAGLLGPFLSRDHYAAFMELVLPVAVFEALNSDRKRVLYMAMAGTIFASVIAGASRAGGVLMIVEVAAVLLLAAVRGLTHGRRFRLAFASLLAFTLMFGSVVGWLKLWERFKEPDPYRFRREMLLSAVAMVRDRPWTGFGLGNFENAYPAYALFDEGSIVNHAHNDWAEWAADGGVPFLALLVALGIWSVPSAARSLWGVGIIAVLLHSLVDFHLQTPAIAAWLFVLLGAVSAEGQQSARSRDPVRRRAAIYG